MEELIWLAVGFASIYILVTVGLKVSLTFLQRKAKQLKANVQIEESLLRAAEEELRVFMERNCPYRYRGYGCNLCYQAEVVNQRLGMSGVFCVVQDSDCQTCKRSFVVPSIPTLKERGGETECNHGKKTGRTKNAKNEQRGGTE